MNITEVRVKLMQRRTDRLRAFCSITIDNDFVVHDLRVIEGRKGLFVAMPSRKLSDNCPRCGAKNELRAKHCGECGAKLDEDRGPRAATGRDKYHVDVAHPINTPCREVLQKTVLAAYAEEEGRATAGLPPLHEYAPAGVEDLTTDYAVMEEAEAEAVAYQEPEYEEPRVPPEGEGQPQTPAPEGRASGAEPEEGAQRPEKAAPEERRPRRSRRPPESGGFGEGLR